jgi:hypothetical protein
MLKTVSNLPRTLNPSLNATGYTAAVSAVYAVVVMIFNVSHHDGVINVPVLLAAVTAVAALLTRQRVTPVADPVDGAGRPLVPKDDSVTALLSRGMAGVELGAVNALRTEAGLPPLSQEAHTVPLEPVPASGGGGGGEFAAGNLHVGAQHPGVSRVIAEGGRTPEPPATPGGF